jgi:hypothetical protein
MTNAENPLAAGAGAYGALQNGFMVGVGNGEGPCFTQ